MNNETYEALKGVLEKTRALLSEKYGHRKRLKQDETWEKAVLIRDIAQVEVWIDEVAKEYCNHETFKKELACNHCTPPAF